MKTYLTPGMVRQMSPGTTYNLAYDDFNKSRFRWTFQRAWEEEHPQLGKHLRCVGRADPGLEGMPYDMAFYEFRGPHRDGSTAAIMCSGSGAERVFFTRLPRGFRVEQPDEQVFAEAQRLADELLEQGHVEQVRRLARRQRR